MKTIYYKGHIIEGVEQQTGTDLMWVNSEHHRSIQVQGDHNWRDFQELVRGVDYEVKQDEYKTGIYDNCIHEKVFEEPYAIPLKPKEDIK